MKATLTFDLNEDQSTMQINDLPPMEIDNFTFRDCFYTFLNRVSSKDMNEYFYLFHKYFGKETHSSRRVGGRNCRSPLVSK